MSCLPGCFAPRLIVDVSSPTMRAERRVPYDSSLDDRSHVIMLTSSSCRIVTVIVDCYVYLL